MCVGFPEQIPQAIVIEALVRQQRIHFDAVDQFRRGDAVVALAGQKNETGEIAERVDKSDDLRRQAAARTPDGLMTRPPFAPMPC